MLQRWWFKSHSPTLQNKKKGENDHWFIKGDTNNPPKTKRQPPTLPSATMSFTPRRQPSTRDPLERAEERMLQDAMKASLSLQENQNPLSPVKRMPSVEPGLLSAYYAVLKTQGHTNYSIGC